ncbi:MAG: hypothetical protein ACE5J7_01895 [Candidatus Aenigmatarchaeota archaeon]
MGAGKILLGLIFLIGGLWLILPLNLGNYSGYTWEAFKTVFFGLVPPLFAFIGFLIIWIESEEVKAGRGIKRKK